MKKSTFREVTVLGHLGRPTQIAFWLVYRHSSIANLDTYAFNHNSEHQIPADTSLVLINGKVKPVEEAKEYKK